MGTFYQSPAVRHEDLLSIALGKVAGVSLIDKFGHGTVGTSFTLITEGSLTANVITTEKVNVASTDADDTAAGLGARNVVLVGVDSLGNVVSEQVALDGTNNVLSTKEYLRIHRMYCVDSGTAGGTNQGTISATQQTSGAVLQQILADNGQTLHASYPIPRDHTGYLVGARFSSESSKSATIRVKTQENYIATSAPFGARRTREYFSGLSGVFNEEFLAPIELPELTEISVEAKVASGTDECSAELVIILVRNS